MGASPQAHIPNAWCLSFFTKFLQGSICLKDGRTWTPQPVARLLEICQLVIETNSLTASVNKGFQECWSVLLNLEIPKEVKFIENISDFPAFSSKVCLPML